MKPVWSSAINILKSQLVNTAGFVWITEFKSKVAPVSVFPVRFTDMRSAVCFIVSESQNHFGMKLVSSFKPDPPHSQVYTYGSIVVVILVLCGVGPFASLW